MFWRASSVLAVGMKEVQAGRLDAAQQAALEGRASHVVTGDRRFLALREYGGVAIVTPRAILGLLGA